MRYRLRTLMIAAAVLGAAFARIGYSKRMASHHRALAADAVQRVSVSTGAPPRLVKSWLAPYAQYDSKFRCNPWGNPFDMETDELAVDWKNAVYHTAMAISYDDHQLLPAPTIKLEPVDSPRAKRSREWPKNTMMPSRRLPPGNLAP